MSREGTLPEKRFVVEVKEPVPGDSVGEIAAVIAGRFGMDPGRVHKLLDGRTGAVTKPVLKEKANLIAQAFAEAGVAVSMRPAELDAGSGAPDGRLDLPVETAGPQLRPAGDATPSTMLLSSTRWVPSPHEEPDPGSLDPGQIAEASDDQPPRETVPPPPHVSASPPGSRGLGLRGYLLIGFTASLVLLLVLQAINGMEAGRTHPPASMSAGMAAYNNGDFAQARRLWNPLAQAGDPRAQYMLGYMAENGQGRPWSNHAAAAWYRLAADQDYPQAQLALGSLYARGMGVPRDAGQAAAYFEQAAREGYGPGQFQYALALFHGAGVKQDFAQALHWFKAAAQNGVPEAKPYVTFAGSALNGSSAPATGKTGASGQGP
jgi:hypothetical protein